MMEDYCSFEVAKLLKEKEFNTPCRAYYNMGALKQDITCPCDWSNSNYIDHISAPTHQMAMKYLREKDIYISVERSFLDNDYIALVNTKEKHVSYNNWREYHKTYEEAVEAALKYCLNNLNLKSELGDRDVCFP